MKSWYCTDTFWYTTGHIILKGQVFHCVADDLPLPRAAKRDDYFNYWSSI